MKFVYDKLSGYSSTIEYLTSSEETWFNSRKPLHILPDLPPKIANKFRKEHIKGFVTIGGCNYYLGLTVDKKLIGVLGFQNPDYGSYDIMLKADTTPSAYLFSTDLLLYILKTKQVQEFLENRFNRKIKNCYSLAFSKHHQINRYRKHAKQIQKKPIEDKDKKITGYNIGYLFEMGTIPTIKAAKGLFIQKHFK